MATRSMKDRIAEFTDLGLDLKDAVLMARGDIEREEKEREREERQRERDHELNLEKLKQENAIEKTVQIDDVAGLRQALAEAAIQARPPGWQRVLFGSTTVLSLGGGVLALVGYETQGGIISVATGLVTFSAGATSNLVMYLCQQQKVILAQQEVLDNFVPSPV